MTTLTLKEKAYAHLREVILKGELKPGDFLTERTLVEMLGMSRTPIRAALERLDVEGLAKYTPNKGLIVAEISMNRVIDFFDYRMAIECYVVRRLAERHWSKEDVEWFRENLRLQRQYVAELDYVSFTQADSLFHRKLMKVYDNSEITATMEQLQDRMFQIALKVLRKEQSRIQASYEDHAQIFEYIVQGNSDKANQQMEQHLEYGKQILIM